jgi:hypothetical protein
LNKTYGNEDWQKQFEIVRNLKPIAEKLGGSQAQVSSHLDIKDQMLTFSLDCDGLGFS